MELNSDRLHELLGKVVGDIGAAMSAALTLIGDRLGLYRALAVGPTDSASLAQRTGTSERMVREWLLNQAAGGYITYDPKTRLYSMTPEQRAAFADDGGPASMLGAFDIVASVHLDVPAVQEAFRHGRGLPWGAHNSCLFCGTERFFAPSYRANLVGQWLPAVNGIVDRLKAGGIVADVGCGHGASTVIMAAAFPRSTFIGYDMHGPSIDCARKRAQDAGLANARFEVADATSFPEHAGGYDLVTCFDCLHDMGDPVGCARRVAGTLKRDGSWMIVEPAAGDTVESNLNPVGRVYSAASTMICVPASMASGGPALGACAGEQKIGDVARRGGFARFTRATQTPFNLVYQATR